MKSEKKGHCLLQSSMASLKGMIILGVDFKDRRMNVLT